ncbi:MAG: insulinase family protein [Gammaproteobacteria bacterium]|nr:insulinase family protein [Gammaproteobacteria bacterium]
MNGQVKQLSNGLTICIVDTVSYLAGISIWLPFGSSVETETQKGWTHLNEHLSFRSPTQQTSREFALNLERDGAIFSAQTGIEHVGYYCRIPYHNFSKGVRLLRRIAFEKIHTSTKAIMNEVKIQAQESLASRSAGQQLRRLALNNIFPKSHRVTPGVSPIETPDQVEQFMLFREMHFHPRGAIVLVFHPKPDVAMEIVEDELGMCEGKDRVALAPQTLGEYERVKVYQGRVASTHVAVAFPAPPFPSPAHELMNVFNRIIALGFGARLYQRLVEIDARTYSLQTNHDAFAHFGGYTISATSTDKAEDFSKYFEDTVRDELTRIITDGLHRDEVSRAIERYISYLHLLPENKLKYSRQIALHMIYNNKPFNIRDIEILLRHTQSADFVRMAMEYLHPDLMSVAILRPKESN